jgi:esterase/lipase
MKHAFFILQHHPTLFTMRLFKIFLLLFAFLFGFYLLGEAPDAPELNSNLPTVPALASLDTYVTEKESYHKLKEDNEARIVWANDSLRNKTRYAVVYLHGFTASQKEGDPVHREFAKRYGCNLYLSRLSDHGIDTSDALSRMTADNLWESAKEAYAIGRQLGDSVILMGTSTGGTLALMLAAQYPEIHSLILLSPNIEIKDPSAWLLNNHWGSHLAQVIVGGKYLKANDERPLFKKYWNTPYRLEAAVQLQEMLEVSMTESNFKKIRQPVLMMYYFKDEENQDAVVKVSAMQRMFEQLGTAPSRKLEKALPNTGDHVIGSPIKSADVASVTATANEFAEKILNLPPL